MYKIDFNSLFTPLPGEKEKPEKMSDILALVIGKSQSKRDPLKLWKWVQKLTADGVLVFDKADLETFKAVIIENEFLNIAGKGEILELVADAKEEEK